MKLSELLGHTLTFTDLETTGRPHEYFFSIIEIGVVRVTPISIVERSSLINPRMKIPSHIVEFTGINDDMVKDSPFFTHFAPYYQKVAKSDIFLGYNSKSFDSKGIEKMLKKNEIYDSFDNQIDIFHLFQRCKKNFFNEHSRGGSLVEACKMFGITVEGKAHRAAYDIAITALLAEELLERFGFGILHKDITKINSSKAKENYFKYIVSNKIKTIS
jgi:DNA polymerase III alpha subunit (gram-positive type)